MMQEILKVEDLTVGYGDVEIVRDVSFSVEKGEILGIVGESGCGKSTLMKAVMQLMGPNAYIPKGSIHFAGKDLLSISAEEMRQLRGDRLGVVFQNPGVTLNPLRKIKAQFIETMRSHKQIGKEEALASILQMLAKLNLPEGERVLQSYPFELSGGMNQRVALALAMIMEPELILADEPTSALDVTVQAQAVEEMLRLREQFGTAIIIVTHSMGVIAHMVDRVGVMYAGRMIEYGDKADVMAHTAHPYTRALMDAIPSLDGTLPVGIEGHPPTFQEAATGCAFAPRCRHCVDACRTTVPELRAVGGSCHKTSCIRVQEGGLKL